MNGHRYTEQGGCCWLPGTDPDDEDLIVELVPVWKIALTI